MTKLRKVSEIRSVPTISESDAEIVLGSNQILKNEVRLVQGFALELAPNAKAVIALNFDGEVELSHGFMLSPPAAKQLAKALKQTVKQYLNKDK